MIRVSQKNASRLQALASYAQLCERRDVSTKEERDPGLLFLPYDVDNLRTSRIMYD